MDFKDYYKTLGVQPNANLESIKTAYRKLSKKFHPDVNNGDKFFEEKFKEIQEAYEILGDTSKRKQYDYKRTNFKNPNNSNNYEYEDNLRRKEEELRKQKEEFKKWEDSLRKKEEILSEKEKHKVKQVNKPLYVILIFLIVILSLTLIYFTVDNKKSNILRATSNRLPTDTTTVTVGNIDNVKQPLAQTEVIKGEPSLFDSKEDLHESSQVENNNYSTKKSLNIEFRNSELAKTVDGKWTGSAFQYNLQESWTIKFTCNSKEGLFLIEYPSLECIGTLSIENITNDEIEFRENIQQGNCINNGKIILKRINNKRFEYFAYLSNNGDIIAKGQIRKK